MPIHETQKPQAIMLLACINMATKAGSPLSDSDVTGRATLDALITQIQTRRDNIMNSETAKVIFNYLTNNLKGLKDQFGDAIVAAFTSVKGTAAATDLRFYVWSLLGDASFNIDYADMVDGAFVLGS
jgi:hypothetical protein